MAKNRLPRAPRRPRFSIENIRVGLSPLSNELFIYRHGKDPRLALEKRSATPEIMSTVMDYFFHDVEDDVPGIEQTFEINGDLFQVTIIRSRPKPKAAVLTLVEEIADFDQTPEEAKKELEEDGVDYQAFLNSLPLPAPPSLVRLMARESPSRPASPEPTCRCAAAAVDPNSPCEVPGHNLLRPNGEEP